MKVNGKVRAGLEILLWGGALFAPVTSAPYVLRVPHPIERIHDIISKKTFSNNKTLENE